jgi:uncharacterized protein (DUF58 family)
MQQYKRWVIYPASVFLVLAAALTGAAQMYYMAAILLCLPMVSYSLGMLSLRDLEFWRETPGSGWDGETADFHLVVRSKAKTARLFLEADDHLPEWLEPTNPGPILFSVPAKSVTRVPYQIALKKRGAYNLDTLTVRATDPLGIYSFVKRIHVDSEFLVFPVPEAIPDIVLSGAERYGFRDLPVAAARGSGVDPDGVRAYVPGDPLRRMHWKSTARTGKLNVIEFEESRAVNVILVLDQFRGSDTGQGRESSFEYLIRTAASLAQSAIRQGASVRLVSGDEPNVSSAYGRGSDHLYSILRDLARAEPADEEPLSATIVARVGILPAGTTLVVLNSGLDKELPGALMHYTMNGAQVVVVYADPRSFVKESRIPSREAQRALMEGFFAANAVPFVLTHQEDHSLKPEALEDVRPFQ